MPTALASSVAERWFALQLEVHQCLAAAQGGADDGAAAARDRGGASLLLRTEASVLLRTDTSVPLRTDASVLLRTLADRKPGAWSDADCAALRRVDPERLSHEELIDFVAVIEHQKSSLDAAQLRALGALDRRDTSGVQAVREEVACVLQIAPAAAQTRLKQARALTDHLPLTLAALDAGALTVRHAQMLCAMSWRVDPAVAGEVEATVLADSTGMTPAMLHRAITRAVVRADPGGSAARHEAATADRCVDVAAGDDGMAYLTVFGPAEDVLTVYTRLDAAVRLLPADDARTLGQKRFDLLLDGLLSGIPAHTLPTAHGRTPHICVTVAATTLLGLDDHPADLTGFGAIDADVARRLSADPTGTWRRIVTDPVTGQIIEYGRSTYRPPQVLIDHVTARDRRCRFPGCSAPAHRCDLDHVHPWEDGGGTTADNLAALCRRHHNLKTAKRWSYRLQRGGSTKWTSPGGRKYRPRIDPTGERAAAGIPVPLLHTVKIVAGVIRDDTPPF